MVAEVPMTPTSPVRVAATARRTAGRITSTTGTSYRSRASARQAAEAVLHAMTRIFTPLSTSRSPTANACRRTSAMGSGPYGPFAVSPTYRTRSPGNWSMIARATVSPPTPESKMPIGAVTSELTSPTLPPGASGGDRPPLPVGPADDEGGQHPAERPEQVRLPGHGDHARDVGRRHPHDAGPEQAAVEHEQDQAEQDVLP